MKIDIHLDDIKTNFTTLKALSNKIKSRDKNEDLVNYSPFVCLEKIGLKHQNLIETKVCDIK